MASKLRVDEIVDAAGTGGPKVKGRTDGVEPGAGEIGEYLEVTNGAFTGVSNNVWGDLTSGLTISAGIWELQAHASFDLNSNDVKYVQIAIGTVTGNDPTGVDAARNSCKFGINGNATANVFSSPSYDTDLITPVWRVNLSSSTTYYVKVYAIFNSGIVQTESVTLKATRIA